MKRYLEITFALLVILTTQTMYMKLTNSILPLLLPMLTVAVVFTLVVLHSPQLRRIHKNILASVVIATCCFLLIPVLHILFLRTINYSATLKISLLYVVFFFFCILYFQLSAEHIRQFLLDFEDIFMLITTFSLILYFLGQVFHWLPPSGVVWYRWGGLRATSTWYGLLFTPQAMSAYHHLQNGRFTGIFIEAPVFAAVLDSVLILMLFVNKRKIPLWKIVILGISIYAVASTTIYLITGLSLIAKFFFIHFKSRSLNIAKVLICILLCVITPILALLIIQLKYRSDHGSMQARINGGLTLIHLFFSSPLYGYGFKQNGIGENEIPLGSVAQLAQQGGILFLLWFFLPVTSCVVRFLHLRRFHYLIALLIYVALSLFTPITYTPFFVAMTAIFLCIGVKRFPRAFKSRFMEIV